MLFRRVIIQKIKLDFFKLDLAVIYICFCYYVFLKIQKSQLNIKIKF